MDKSEPLADNVIMDVDKKGKAIGIEILLPEKDSRVNELVSQAIITDHRERKKRLQVLYGCIDKEPLSDEAIRGIEEALEDIKKGQLYSEERIMKEFDLK